MIQGLRHFVPISVRVLMVVIILLTWSSYAVTDDWDAENMWFDAVGGDGSDDGGGGGVAETCDECQDNCMVRFDAAVETCDKYTGPAVEACMVAAYHSLEICMTNCETDFTDC